MLNFLKIVIFPRENAYFQGFTFLASIFKGFGARFGRVFNRFFGPKMHKICKSTLLAKTLKIVIFPRENAYFQEIED